MLQKSVITGVGFFVCFAFSFAPEKWLLNIHERNHRSMKAFSRQSSKYCQGSEVRKDIKWLVHWQYQVALGRPMNSTWDLLPTRGICGSVSYPLRSLLKCTSSLRTMGTTLLKIANVPPSYRPVSLTLKDGLERGAQTPGGHIQHMALTLKTPFPLERAIAEKGQNRTSYSSGPEQGPYSPGLGL